MQLAKGEQVTLDSDVAFLFWLWKNNLTQIDLLETEKDIAQLLLDMDIEYNAALAGRVERELEQRNG